MKFNHPPSLPTPFFFFLFFLFLFPPSPPDLPTHSSTTLSLNGTHPANHTNLPALPKAQYAVGYFTEMGIGCRRDPLEANMWYVRAAELGDTTARQRLDIIRAAAAGEEGVHMMRGKARVKELRGGGGGGGEGRDNEGAKEGGKEKGREKEKEKEGGGKEGGKEKECIVM